MESIEPKVIAVRQYIMFRKGIDVGDIKIETHEDCMKLNYALNCIREWQRR